MLTLDLLQSFEVLSQSQSSAARNAFSNLLFAAVFVLSEAFNSVPDFDGILAPGAMMNIFALNKEMYDHITKPGDNASFVEESDSL